MHGSTARLMTVLELLQARRRMGSGELARRLEVDERTVRRYVATLQGMGIPVEGERGRYGGYALKPGYKLPPLMFTDEEALGLGLSLLAARGMGLSDIAPAVEGALAKVERSMPEQLRERLRTLGETVTLVALKPPTPPDREVVAEMADAVSHRRQVRMRYRSVRLEETERAVDPYSLLYGERRWYVFGYCHLRDGLRLFRLDRVIEVEQLEATFGRPAGLEDPAEVLRIIVNTPARWEIEVLLETTLDHAREQIPPMLASLEEVEDGILLRCTVNGLNEMARILSGLFCPFVVRQPPELNDEIRAHAEELMALARGSES